MNLLTKTLNKIFKSSNQQELDGIKPLINEINNHEEATILLKDSEFKEKTYLHEQSFALQNVIQKCVNYFKTKLAPKKL